MPKTKPDTQTKEEKDTKETTELKTVTSAKNLYQKLVEIRKNVKHLKKKHQGHQYKYVSSSQAIQSVRDKMDELNVLLVPSVKDASHKGKFTYLDMQFEWINGDDPADRMAVDWYSQGTDTQEKGVGKAYTYAEKYFILKFFNIPTDESDPDAYQQEEEGIVEEDYIAKLEEASDLEDLKRIWKDIYPIVKGNETVAQKKQELKAQFTQENDEGN